MAFEKPLIFKKLNKKLLCLIFKNLSCDDLSRLNQTCRRFNNAVQHHVRELQVLVDLDDEGRFFTNLDFKHVVLKFCSPMNFLYPHSPFKYINSLFLNFDDSEYEKINLTKLTHLKYLKIRGK